MDIASCITTDTSTVDTMRTEAEFVEQAELARTALQQFTVIKDFANSDGAKLCALNQLIKVTVCCPLHFLLFFMTLIFIRFFSTIISNSSTIRSFLSFPPLSTRLSRTSTRSTQVFRSRKIFPRSTDFVAALTII